MDAFSTVSVPTGQVPQEPLTALQSPPPPVTPVTLPPDPLSPPVTPVTVEPPTSSGFEDLLKLLESAPPEPAPEITVSDNPDLDAQERFVPAADSQDSPRSGSPFGQRNLDDASSTTDEGKKSPLEVLEDILAGAKAEKDLEAEEEAQKKAAEEEAARKEAEALAEFQREAAQKLVESAGAVAEAKAQREAVEEELVRSGKADAATPTVQDKQHEIVQLVHETQDVPA